MRKYPPERLALVRQFLLQYEGINTRELPRDPVEWIQLKLGCSTREAQQMIAAADPAGRANDPPSVAVQENAVASLAMQRVEVRAIWRVNARRVSDASYGQPYARALVAALNALDWMAGYRENNYCEACGKPADEPSQTRCPHCGDRMRPGEEL